jgi:hypothetical protein
MFQSLHAHAREARLTDGPTGAIFGTGAPGGDSERALCIGATAVRWHAPSAYPATISRIR